MATACGGNQGDDRSAQDERSGGDARIAALERFPEDGVAWANPGKRPAQAAILGGSAAIGGAATGLRATDAALTTADTHSSDAMQLASSSTENALGKTYRSVIKALQSAVGSPNQAKKK